MYELKSLVYPNCVQVQEKHLEYVCLSETSSIKKIHSVPSSFFAVSRDLPSSCQSCQNLFDSIRNASWDAFTPIPELELFRSISCHFCVDIRGLFDFRA